MIVDTAGKAAGYAKAGDENDAVIGRQIIAVLATASRETSALVLGVDHFGKSAETGTRGSSAKEADCDAVLALLGDKNMAGEVANPRLAIRKRRSGANGIEIPFRPKVVTVDKSGDETTLVVDWLQPDQVGPSPKADNWPKSLRLLRQVLMNVLVDHGTDQRPFLDGPTVRAVDIENVRKEFYASHPAEGTDKQKAAARRRMVRKREELRRGVAERGASIGELTTQLSREAEVHQENLERIREACRIIKESCMAALASRGQPLSGSGYPTERRACGSARR